ncbi:MAG: hypothetical protein Q8S04_08550 [Bacteroidales bacterium]|jgi:type IV secretory pathway VirB3-like protein|nr:hypothetical protein [Bacteroidales bacterium]
MQSLLIFYKKLIIPSAIFSIMIGMTGIMATGTFSLKYTGLAYLFICPMVHFFVYDVRYSNDYYFYYNLGLSRKSLWASTLVISGIACLILILI